MSVKQELLSTLESSGDHQSLLRQVRQYESQGVTPQELYSVLEQIWLERGFDADTEGGRIREDLEYVMEKVWFQGAK